jgi:hypothetical protein
MELNPTHTTYIDLSIWLADPNNCRKGLFLTRGKRKIEKKRRFAGDVSTVDGFESQPPHT